MNDAIARAWKHVRRREITHAQEIFEQHVRENPDSAAALAGLGWCAYQRKELAAAEALFRRALTADPSFAEAHLQFASVQRATEQWDAAVASARRATELAPSEARFHAGLGSLLLERDQLVAAEAELRRAHELSSSDAMVLVNLADVRARSGDAVEAEQFARQAIALAPKSPLAHAKLSFALHQQGKTADAEQALRDALAEQPYDPTLHWNLAALLLQLGRLQEAWPHYEARLYLPDPVHLESLATPRWDGSPLRGKTLLVEAEQGIGDTIQFARFIPILAEPDAHVVLRVDRSLIGVLGTLSRGEVASNDRPPPTHDFHLPLMSLGFRMGVTLDNIPAQVPYLFADAGLKASIAQRIAGPQRLRIGLTWAGNPANPGDATRSMDPAHFAPLRELGDIRWISLQKNRREPAPPLKLLDLTQQLDFTATAALIANLDLVIGVDTAMVHLAGALGRRAWLLLSHSPDWRWMLHRDDSPWYPTLRIFRQPRAGDWRTVIETVARELRKISGNSP